MPGLLLLWHRCMRARAPHSQQWFKRRRGSSLLSVPLHISFPTLSTELLISFLH